jgi:DTW domain-containing protein YfiP
VAAPVLRKLLSRRLSLFDDAQQLVAYRLREKQDDEVNDTYVRKTAESVAKTLLKKEAKQSARQISDEFEVIDEATISGSPRTHRRVARAPSGYPSRPTSS